MRLGLLEPQKANSKKRRLDADGTFAAFDESFLQEAEIILSVEQAETLMNWLCERLYGFRITPVPKEK